MWLGGVRGRPGRVGEAVPPGLAAATVAVLLGLPAGGLAEFVTKGYTRVGTSIGFFAGLIALGGLLAEGSSIARLALYTAVVGLTLLSDTYMLVIAVAAVLVVCLVGVAATGDVREPRAGANRARHVPGGAVRTSGDLADPSTGRV